MADSDHRQGVTAVSQDLLEPPVAATTSASSSSHDDEEEEEEDGFTFAAVPRLPFSGAFHDGRLGPVVYPVFGRPRSPPGREEEEEDLGTATMMVPLAQLLMAERSAPSAEEPADDEGGEGLDGVPAETYCLWSPGASPSPARGSHQTPSPARCRKSGSTGSVLRWRQRVVVGRSHSDGKEKFVFIKDESSERSSTGGGGHGWMMGSERSGKGGSGDRKSTFLPYKQDLVGFFANAGAFRRSYLPF